MNDGPKQDGLGPVFLSYASQDVVAAAAICDALGALGIEVWFDRSELVGGDLWDKKIRGQISECVLFLPVISANTQSRLEGYFRIEWKLAAQRTHGMADAKPFLIPVVVDGTKDLEAHVPDEFRTVQWSRLQADPSAAALAKRVRQLVVENAAGGSSRPFATATVAGYRPANAWKGWIGVGFIAVAALVIGIVGMRREKASGAAAPGVESLSPAANAAGLVARARTILDGGDEMNRETYALAEELLKKAEELDLTNAEAWGLHAQISANLVFHGLDPSPARRTALKSQADRADRLAPEALDTQLAVARANFTARIEVPETLKRLEALLEKFPDDVRIHRAIVQGQGVAGDWGKRMEKTVRALKKFPDDPSLKTDLVSGYLLGGNYAEAEAAVNKVMVGRTSVRLLANALIIRLRWRGDLAGATALCRSWPGWFLQEDRGSSLAAIALLWNREPLLALENLQKFPRDYIRDSFYVGPVAVLSAFAHEQAEQHESALSDWRRVLTICDRELAASPDDPTALQWKAWALARLGRRDEGLRILKSFEEREENAEGYAQVGGGLGGLALALGDVEDAMTQITRIPSPARLKTKPRPVTKADFALNPRFDALQDNPRFQAIIAAAAGHQVSARPVRPTGAGAAPAAAAASAPRR